MPVIVPSQYYTAFYTKVISLVPSDLYGVLTKTLCSGCKMALLIH